MKFPLLNALLVLCALAAGCRENAAANKAKVLPEKTFAGLYTHGQPTGTFRDCETGKIYEVVDPTHALDTLYPNFLQKPNTPGEPIFTQFKAFVQAESDNAQGIGGRLTIVQVDSSDYVNPTNFCLPWEFWCFGTEPFWSLRISPPGKDGQIMLKNLGEEKAYAYAAVQPQTDGKTWTYSTLDSAGKAVKITVKKEAANDGMSEMKYHYSCQILRAGEGKLEGVAIRSGEPMPVE